MISWYKKVRIRRIALNDAKGSYGQFLEFRQKKLEEIPAVIVDFDPSDWMKLLVSNYKNMTEKTINNNKKVNTLYEQIRQCHERLIEENNEFSRREFAISSVVARIDAEITDIDAKLSEIFMLLSGFYEGNPLPNGLTPHKLQCTKADLEQEKAQKQSERESVSNMTAIATKHNKHVKELRNEVLTLESDFYQQIDQIYKAFHKKEIRYNEQLGYYWQKLCEGIQHKSLRKNSQRTQGQHDNSRGTVRVTESMKRINDIAAFCGMTLPSKDDLFRRERDYINSTVNQSFKIQYKV